MWKYLNNLDGYFGRLDGHGTQGWFGNNTTETENASVKDENEITAWTESMEHSSNETLHRGNSKGALELASQVRILCWIMTQPENHYKKAIHVKRTWGKRCNKLIFISSEDGKSYIIKI